MTTTTAQAANVLSHLEYYLQIVWPELNVNVVSQQNNGRVQLLQDPNLEIYYKNYFQSIDVSNEGLPFMGYLEGKFIWSSMQEFLEFHFQVNLRMKLNVESDQWKLYVGKNNRDGQRI